MSQANQNSTSGCTVQDFMKLLKNNPLVQERLQNINFSVQTYQNRMNLGTLGQKRNAVRESVISESMGSSGSRGMRQSNTL
jgi:hypothetical protein